VTQKPIQVDQLTGEDWGKIHAMAWRDDRFRDLLEANPTAAVQEYGNRVGKVFKKILILRRRPQNIPDEFLADINPFPPSCC
jgi:hypothetical protein